MTSIAKNQKGFALAFMMALLPILMGVMLATFAILGFIQLDQEFQYVCRSEGLEGQERVAPLLKTLFLLNPLATTLRAQKIATQAELAAAIASGNPIAIAKATARLEKIQERQEKLDARQKQLIQQSNLSLQKAFSLGQYKLQREGKSTHEIPILTGHFAVLPGTAPVLAVHPDSTDVAPTYSLEDNFEDKQALVQRWQYSLTMIRPLRRFAIGDFAFKKSCAVTLKEENSQWQAKVKKDKSF